MPPYYRPEAMGLVSIHTRVFVRTNPRQAARRILSLHARWLNDDMERGTNRKLPKSHYYSLRTYWVRKGSRKKISRRKVSRTDTRYRGARTHPHQSHIFAPIQASQVS